MKIKAEDIKTIGVELQKLRGEKKITQESMAKMIGCNKTQLSRFETCKYIPKLTSMNRYLKALGYSFEIVIFKEKQSND